MWYFLFFVVFKAQERQKEAEMELVENFLNIIILLMIVMF